MNLLSRFNKPTPRQPVEVGIVDWGRDLDEAKGLSNDTGKPVFALFQEVPGCAGCKQFGRDVLSDPAIVGAIEEVFVPLLIHNNTPGRDAEVLEAFGEPAWNYQVVRFLDAEGNDIIPRRDRVWESGPLADRMIQTLEHAGRPVPAYLRLLEQEHADRLQLVHFAQPCFWVGEAELGPVDGVVATQAAFMGGHEVTSVWFDPAAVSLDELTTEAERRSVASLVFTDEAGLATLEPGRVEAQLVDDASHRVAPVSDQKRQLRGVHGLGNLTIGQLTKLNGLLHRDPAAAAQYLPPSERHLIERR